MGSPWDHGVAPTAFDLGGLDDQAEAVDQLGADGLRQVASVVDSGENGRAVVAVS